MRDNFDAALKLVLKHEGGYSNHPSDPGGATNLGITIATYRAYINANGNVDMLKAMTVAQAGIVYRKQYWAAVRGDDLPAGLDYAVFDFAVNSGVSRAAKYLQMIVGVEADGEIGPKTIAAVNKADAMKVIDELCRRRLSFLQSLKTWDVFGRGWGSRVAGVKLEALKMAKNAPAVQTIQPSAPAPIPASPVDPVPAEPPSSGGWIAAIIAIIAAIFGARK